MAADYRLTKKEGNALYAFAEKIGLQPLVLSYESQLSNTISVLSHPPTGHRFKFGVAHSLEGSGFRSDWSPLIENRVLSIHTTRLEQLELALTWMTVVKEEHETVDLWKVAAEEAALVAGGPIEDGDRGFTIQEQKLLTERLAQLEQKIVELAKPTPEQKVELTVTIQHAKDAAARTSRTDWKSLFAGKLFEVIVKLGLESEQVRQLLHYAWVYVGPLVSKVAGLLS